MPLTPTLIGHFAQGDAQAVSRQNRLPVDATTPDTLLVATTTVTTDANRDLLGSTSTELPTLDGCMQYRKLVWFYFRTAQGHHHELPHSRTRHRPCNGAPLGSGWQELAYRHAARRRDPAGDASKSPHRRRLLRPVPHRSARTAGGSNYTLTSKIVGVR
jgi:hypothetical protein